MSLITVPELNLNYELENSKLTEEYIINNFKTVRNGLLKEIIENFGSYMGPVKFDTKYKTIFDVTPEQKETLNPNVELPSENKENIIDGLLRFSKALNFGSDSGNYSAWVSCVKLMGAWYENNVHTYSHDGNYMHCPLINKNIRPDCSGYVGACLQLYGLLGDYSWMPSSGYYVNDEKLAEELRKGGFIKMDFSWDILEPFDIMSHAPTTGPSGHVEIFAGNQNGSMKSYGWGSRHDKESGKCMPWYTTKDKYTVIWRCVGGGSLSGGGSLFGNLPNVISSASMKINAEVVINALMSALDLTRKQAAGIAGVLAAESGINPKSYNTAERNGKLPSSGANNTGAAYGQKHCPWSYGAGICQWTFTNRKENAIMGGLNISRAEAKSIIINGGIESLPLNKQISMLIYELKTAYKNTLIGIKKCSTAPQAAATYYCHSVAGYSTSKEPATQEEVNHHNRRYSSVGASSQINKGMAFAEKLC